jgi:hypothetical protein
VAEHPEIPENIRTLIKRCEINESAFDNDDMSQVLKFAEMLWRDVSRLAMHYENKAVEISSRSHVKSTLAEVVTTAINIRNTLRHCAAMCREPCDV